MIYKLPAGSTTPVAIGTVGGSPVGMTVDATGNVFVAEFPNADAVIAEIPVSATSPTGYGPTVKLNPPSGNPEGVVVAPDGTLYYVITDGNVYKMTWSGSGTTYNAPTIFASGFNSLNGIALDTSGNIYVSDAGVVQIVKIAPDGTRTPVPFNFNTPDFPVGLAVDAAGDVYSANANKNQIIEVPFTAGSYGSPIVVATGLGNPQGLAIDSLGNLVIGNNFGSVVYVDRTTPPSLTFQKTSVGLQSSDSPQSVTVSNIGNGTVPLTLTTPSTGTNPSLTNSSFQFGGGVTCSSSNPLASGASCALPLEFVPTVGGPISGTSVLTDNNLNQVNVTQTISLNGVGVLISLTPTTLSGETIGVTVSQQLTATGGTGPYAFTSVGTLPPGVTLNGMGLLSGVPTTPGTYSFTVTATDSDPAGPFSGIQTYTVTVNKQATTTSLSVSPMATQLGTAVTITAKVQAAVSGIPTGTVTFFSNGVSLGVVPLVNGVAVLTTTSLPAGANVLAAVYSSDANYLASSATASTGGTSVIVTAPDFIVGTTTPVVTVLPSATAAFTITVAPIPGVTFGSPVALSVTGLPANFTATFSPQSVTPGGAMVTSQMSVQTYAALTSKNEQGKGSLPYGLIATALLLPLLSARKLRKKLPKGLLYLLLLSGTFSATAALTGCGGGYFGPSGASYTLTVTGTSGSLQHSTTVTLKVQ